jgi:hypothetical protein
VGWACLEARCRRGGLQPEVALFQLGLEHGGVRHELVVLVTALTERPTGGGFHFAQEPIRIVIYGLCEILDE